MGRRLADPSDFTKENDNSQTSTSDSQAGASVTGGQCEDGEDWLEPVSDSGMNSEEPRRDDPNLSVETGEITQAGPIDSIIATTQSLLDSLRDNDDPVFRGGIGEMISQRLSEYQRLDDTLQYLRSTVHWIQEHRQVPSDGVTCFDVLSEVLPTLCIPNPNGSDGDFMAYGEQRIQISASLRNCCTGLIECLTFHQCHR